VTGRQSGSFDSDGRDAAWISAPSYKVHANPRTARSQRAGVNRRVPTRPGASNRSSDLDQRPRRRPLHRSVTVAMLDGTAYGVTG
jgi:hypothetical protein